MQHFGTERSTIVEWHGHPKPGTIGNGKKKMMNIDSTREKASKAGNVIDQDGGKGRAKDVSPSQPHSPASAHDASNASRFLEEEHKEPDSSSCVSWEPRTDPVL